MAGELHISDPWRKALTALGLDSFRALMTSQAGRCVSRHDRGQTYRIDLPTGKVIYLKRDAYTPPKDILADLCCLRRPDAPCLSELRALRHVRELGIPAPEAIAWGRRPKAGLPWQAVLVTTELTGTSLHRLLRNRPTPQRRQEALLAAARTVATLYRARLSWPDLLPKHLFISDGDAGVLDLARMRRLLRPRRLYMPEQIRRFCNALLACGTEPPDVQTFLAGCRGLRSEAEQPR